MDVITMNDVMAHHVVSGVVAQPVTPLGADTDVGARALGRLLDRTIDTGVDAFAALRHSGENVYLVEPGT
ncbi:hypothetical protein AB0B25_30520 [Nocardia sp. NPDC049190]|uniref:hypothetical protein n=1 Tax=Nocardia sp. NPDC049190 TaxID=3155650 RepID=UPI0033C62A1E